MDRWKSRGGTSQKRREEKRREGKRREGKGREEKRRNKMQACEKVEITKHCVFPRVCDSGGSKSRLAKAAGAEQSGQMRDEKLQAVVARSTFASEKAKSTSPSEHLWKLRCRKVHIIVTRSTFPSRMYKARHSQTTFGS